MVWRLRFLLSMSSQPLLLSEHLKLRCVCFAGCFIAGLYPHHCPPCIWSIGLGCWLGQAYIFGDIQGPDSLSACIAEVTTDLPWRHACLVRLWDSLFLEATYSLEIILRAFFIMSFLGVLFSRGAWWHCETLCPGLHVWTGCVSSFYLLNWFLEDWFSWSRRLHTLAGLALQL